jgi:plastocyanin
MRKLLIAAGLVCAVLAPALAYSQAPSNGSFKANDVGYGGAWTATPGGGSELTLSRPATVEFSYPAGASAHTVSWKSGAAPSCSGVPKGLDFVGGQPGWKGTCTFPEVGEYSFSCGIHPDMTGRVIVTAPAASASPTPPASPSPTPDGTTTPGTTYDPPASGATGATPPTTTVTTAPSYRVAGSQKGTRVRGTVTLAPGSRLEVTVKLGKRRVGRSVKTAGGTTTFSVALDAKARKVLRRKRSLRLSVTVAVTQPGVAKHRRAFSVRLRG